MIADLAALVPSTSTHNGSLTSLYFIPFNMIGYEHAQRDGGMLVLVVFVPFRAHCLINLNTTFPEDLEMVPFFKFVLFANKIPQTTSKFQFHQIFSITKTKPYLRSLKTFVKRYFFQTYKCKKRNKIHGQISKRK